MKETISPTKKPKDVETGKRLKLAREYSGKTRKQLADLIYCSEGLIASMEQGARTLTNDKADSISKVCGVRLEWLCFGSGEMTEHDAVKNLIGNIQRLDTMWTTLIKHIALLSGYETIECNSKVHQDRLKVTIVDTDAPYLVFKRGEQEIPFSLRETNVLIDDLASYSQFRLNKMMKERANNG